MGRSILRLECGGVERFLVWSTVVDTPVSYGLTEQELVEWFTIEHGRSGTERLPAQIDRARRCGTSSLMYESAEKAYALNFAGQRGETLTLDEIWDRYVTPTLDGQP